jgi:hypothetical protein
MPDGTNSRIESLIQRAKLKIQSAIDRDLEILRSMYASKSDSEKQALKEWLSQAATLAVKRNEIRPSAVLKVEFVEPDGSGDDFAVVISVLAAKRAIECWDRGEQYTPSLKEFHGDC